MMQPTHLAPTPDTPRSRLSGQLDAGYGVLGRTCVEYPHFGNIGSESIAYASTLDAAGRLVLAGHSFDAQGTLVASLVRFERNGTPDAEFGLRGFVTMPTQVSSGTAWLRHIVPQADGSLVIAFDVKGAGRRHVLLRRVLPCGRVDSAFLRRSDGAIRFAPASTLDILHRLQVLPNGALQVLATTHLDRFHRPELAMLQLACDGTPDRGYGDEALVGLALIPRPAGARRRRPWLCALAADGDAVVAGDLLDIEGAPAGIAVSRLDPRGRLRAGFGRSGAARVPHSRNDALRALMCRPDGRIVVLLQDGNERGSAYPKIAQLHADGDVDMAFGRQGVVVAPLGVDAGSQRPHAAALLPDGSVLLAGAPWRMPGGQRVLLSRWREDGARDIDFGERGSLSCAFASAVDDESVRVDSVCGIHCVDDRILVAGHMLEYEVRYKYCVVSVHL